MCACLVWQGFACRETYISFLVGRLIMGLGQSPIYSIAPTTIGDMYFLYHHGEKIAFYGLAVLAAANLGPVLSSFIIQSLGPAWAFWILAMFISANMVTMFFFMPETKFIGERPQIVPSLPESKSGLSSQHVEHLEDVHKPSYISGLSIWPKSDPSIDLRTISVRPFLFCLNPIIIWASLVYGMSFISITTFAAIVAQEFGQE